MTNAQDSRPGWAQRLDTFWTAPAPQGAHTNATTRTLSPAARTARAAAWPLAVLLIIHRVFVLARQGSPTDDFTTVWAAARRFVERVPVYNEVYHYVDPHYLYNPGATLLLSPLGLAADPNAVRPLFILANALAIIAALAWCTTLAGRSLRGPVFPVALSLAFATEAVTNTLVFSNINGILLLALTAFLASYRARRFILAGVILGLAILIKPMFAPLLVLPLMQLQLRTVLAGIAVPVLLNAIAWPLTPGAGDYFGRLVPYLSTTRDYANSSLAGFAVYFGMPGWLHGLCFVLFAAAVAVAVLGLARWRFTDEWLWLTCSTAVLLAGVCLLSSLGQAYYTMMLFPAAFTALHKASPFHTGTVWLGLLLCVSPLRFDAEVMGLTGRWLGTFLPTAGWAIFIVAVAAWVVSVQTQTPAKEAHNG
ncbi:glycosyltransferase family 87 protein [Corynebacterium sp. HMSC071B10]|uniref:glycosyltransferase family 87 protein n=1 Tax=Corynebacterium sp. HMSC071B10 TaxID=1739494 RepID=UPI000A81C903|nr:glycosyltransferase family 87 protein [Corynebacterium sp. HMSC071B10]